MNQEIDLNKIVIKLREFANERNWEHYHTPKNLAAALSIEASELLETFLWVSDQNQFEMTSDPKKREAICDEVADVFNYLVRLCDVMEINLEEAFWKKLEKNALKYPPQKP